MSVWAAIIVGFVSGGFGALLGVLNDRQERFRDRMINAADDLVLAGSEALIAVRDAIYRVKNRTPDRDEMISKAWKQRDPLVLRTARVGLLFGPTSDTAGAATSMTDTIRDAIDRVQSTPDSPTSDPDAAQKLYDEAQAQLTSLQVTALAGIRGAKPPSATFRERLRRFWKF